MQIALDLISILIIEGQGIKFCIFSTEIQPLNQKFILAEKSALIELLNYI